MNDLAISPSSTGHDTLVFLGSAVEVQIKGASVKHRSRTLHHTRVPLLQTTGDLEIVPTVVGEDVVVLDRLLVCLFLGEHGYSMPHLDD